LIDSHVISSSSLTGVAVSSSALTIAVLSADRLLAVRRPLSFRVYRASRHAGVIVAGVWTASLAVASPLLHVRRLHTVKLGFGPQNTFNFCHEASYHSSSRNFCHRGLCFCLYVCLFVRNMTQNVTHGFRWNWACLRMLSFAISGLLFSTGWPWEGVTKRAKFPIRNSTRGNVTAKLTAKVNS